MRVERAVVVSIREFTTRSNRQMYNLSLQTAPDGRSEPLSVRYMPANDSTGVVPQFLDIVSGEVRPSQYNGRQEFWLDVAGLVIESAVLEPVTAAVM